MIGSVIPRIVPSFRQIETSSTAAGKGRRRALEPGLARPARRFEGEHGRMGALRPNAKFCLAALLCLVAAPALAQPPALERRGGAVQLVVDGHPFLILG